MITGTALRVGAGGWRTTGCGLPRYRRHRVLCRFFFYAVYAHRETVAEIAKVLLQRSVSGFAGLKTIRFPRGLAHRPPALDASPMIGDDLNNVDHSHSISLRGAVWREDFHPFFTLYRITR